MTLVNALETLKSRGIIKLAGLSGETNIDKFIDNARRCDEDAQRWPEQGWAKYHIEHADENFIVEVDGHYIIATHYDNFDMATYSNFDTEDEMHAAFDEWKVMRDAENIADEMIVSRPNELPRAAWILVAAAELRAANKAAGEAFKREFGKV